MSGDGNRSSTDTKTTQPEITEVEERELEEAIAKAAEERGENLRSSLKRQMMY